MRLGLGRTRRRHPDSDPSAANVIPLTGTLADAAPGAGATAPSARPECTTADDTATSPAANTHRTASGPDSR